MSEPIKKNVPSLRYDLFIKAFEKEVVAAQSRIKAIEAMEQPYNLVKEALEEAKLPNDTSLVLAASVIKVEIKAIPTDLMSLFDPLLAGIGRRLKEAGIHRDGGPSKMDGGWWHHAIRTWRGKLRSDQECTVTVEIDIPEEGLRDCAVVRIERPTISYDWKLEPREPETWAPPANFRTVAVEIVF